MARETLHMDGVAKTSGCQTVHIVVAVGCSLLIAVGLAVGLGVGLSNQNKSASNGPSATTTRPGVITATTTGPGVITATTAGPGVTTATTAGPGVTAATTIATTTANPIPDTGPWLNYRLPTYITPSHYALTLHPNTTTDTYTGSNAMTIDISQETKYILVHVDSELNITSTKLQARDGAGSFQDVAISREFYYSDYEFHVVETEDMLPPKEDYVLTMEFKGSLILRIVGLYKSVYTDPNSGEEKAVVGSDMEPTDARKAYPCFDEPALKVNYTTTLVHEPQLTALSNMPVASNMTRADGLMETTFETSPKMSTYLGCFAISEFVYIEAMSAKNNIPLRVYIPPHQKDAGQADYALEVMKTVFDYFEVLFDMDYTLPKCDMISIPNFGTGAMENWGLITYRETNLLWDPVASSTSNKQRVAAVVAHELVHQWYGNIVTMKWWDNIWLNEGFASYFEYLGEQVAEPDWQILDQFVIDDLQSVMTSDDSVTSHPIVVDVNTPSEITSVFDSISYSKGASVLRYMHSVLGNDTFWGGMRHYLKKRAFSNANEVDLFNDVQEYADSVFHDVNVSSIMLPWVRQMGFPVVTVTNAGAATQEHFLIDPTANLTARPESEFDYRWNVEVTYFTSVNDTVFTEHMEVDGGGVNLAIGSLGNDDWLKVNPGQTGYYRVDYDDAMWATIARQMIANYLVFEEMDRSNLIDDALNLAAAERLSYPHALNMTQYLNNESSYFVWDAFSRGSSYIRSMLETTDVYPNFKTYYLSKVKPTADELGWNATVGTHIDKLNRYLTLSLALRYGDADALNTTSEYFLNWIADASYFLFPDTRQLVYRYGITSASTYEWDVMLDRYIRETVASEKTNLLRGLTSTEDSMLISRMLEYSKNESIIKSQDFFNCITYISYTIPGNEMAWNWTQVNWLYMVDRFEITDRNLGRLVPNIVSDYNTEKKLQEVKDFFALYPEAGAGASGRESAINSINTNIKWMEMNKDNIASWLSEQLGS